MSKDIKDYLPLYIGCFIYIERFGKYKLVAVDLLNELFGIKSGNKTVWHPISADIKIELRPLSSMTEEEKLEGVEVVYNNSIKWSTKESALSTWEGLQPNNSNFVHIELFRWLLSKHFDLFGLIESGLAIDAPKTNQ